MKPLTMKQYLGYMAGDLANNLAFSMQGMFLMIYYTNVVGLNPAPVATMFLLIRFWDAFADLFAGRMVDLTRSRWGKFRPWLLFLSVPLLVSSVVLFSMPGFDGDKTKQYIYMYATYMLLGTLYSLVNIPYGSLATSMTQDPVERARLGVFRSMGPQFGILFLVLIIAPQITKHAKNPDALQSFLTKTTIAFVFIGFALYMITFFTCKEQVPHEGKPVSLKDTGRAFMVNRPLQILCVSNFIFLIGIFGVQGAQAYYAAYVLGDSTKMIWMVVAGSLATFAAVPVVPKLVAKIGKKHTFMIGGAIIVVTGIWLFFMPKTLSVVMISFFLFGFGQQMAMSLLFAFEADAVEYGEYKTGERTEGATYAIYSFFRKMSQALSASLVGYALAFGAFVPRSQANPTPEQPDSAITAIKAVIGLGPALFAIVGMLIFVLYPLTDEKFREIVAETRARKAAQALTDEPAATGR